MEEVGLEEEEQDKDLKRDGGKGKGQLCFPPLSLSLSLSGSWPDADYQPTQPPLSHMTGRKPLQLCTATAFSPHSHGEEMKHFRGSKESQSAQDPRHS